MIDASLYAWLLPFYAAKDVSAALSVLTEMGVTHIHVPDYGLPPLYNSLLYSILRNPALSTLRYQTEKGQVYSLEPEISVSGSQTPVSLVERDWVFQTAVLLGGRKGLVKISGSSASANGAEYRGGLPYDLFQRNWSSGITTSIGQTGQLPEASDSLKIQPSSQYAQDFSLEGEGYVALVVDQFSGDNDGNPTEHLGQMQVASFEMSKKQPRRNFGFRFQPDSSASSFQFTIESIGKSRVKVHNIAYKVLEKSR